MSTYTVLPAGVLDSSHATDSIIVTGWVLDKPVDSMKIMDAWRILTMRWPILLARLRQNAETSRWEYHVPTSPSLEGAFGTLNISGSIADHYRFSVRSDSIRCTPKENPHHLFIPGAPRDVAELLKRDVPLTQLYVTTFTDGSLVGLYTPHILCDGYGVTAIIRSLLSILDGGSPPPPLEHVDPFLPYAETAGEAPAPPYWRALNVVETAALYARAFKQWLFDSNVENKDVFFPASEVKRIKDEAMADLRATHGDNEDVWVSSSDAVLAFCLKCVHPATTSNAPLNVFYTANLRKHIPHPSMFLHNSVCMVITPTLPVSSVSHMSLGDLALHIRHTLEAQTTLAAVETWIRWRLQNADRKKLFFDPWTGEWDVVTNWRDMKLMGVDFSSALPDDALAAGGEQATTKCVYLWGNGIQPIPLRNWIGIWADDPSGGLWTSGFFPRRIWEDVRGFGQFTS